MTRRKLLQHQPAARWPRQHRFPVEPAVDVGTHGIDRGIARLGRLLQRAQRDRIKLRGKIGTQTTNAGTPPRGDLLTNLTAAGQPWIAVENGSFQLASGIVVQLVRQPATDQFIEHHAQGVDVAGRRQGLTQNLLRTGISGRQRPPGQQGQLRRLSGILVVGQHLGDAEVEQTHFALLRDQNVGWFEVAVDDQMGVGMLDRQQYLTEQSQAVAQSQHAGITVLGDRQAAHILERQPGDTVVADPGVEQGRNVGMPQPGQDVALALKAACPGRALSRYLLRQEGQL